MKFKVVSPPVIVTFFRYSIITLYTMFRFDNNNIQVKIANFVSNLLLYRSEQKTFTNAIVYVNRNNIVSMYSKPFQLCFVCKTLTVNWLLFHVTTLL